MGASCTLAIAAFAALLAACQLLAGTLTGDWMHASEVVAAAPWAEKDAWTRWREEQVERAFSAAADVIEGWGIPSSDVGGVLSSGGDDDGVIPSGGARVSTEFGLWLACVWTRTAAGPSGQPEEAVQCRTYAALVPSKGQDDGPWGVAPTPSSANFAAAQALVLTGTAASTLAVLLIVSVLFTAGRRAPAPEGLLAAEGGWSHGDAAEKEEGEESLGRCCSSAGPPFPRSGCAGRALGGAAALLGIALCSSLAALGAWADSAAAQELASMPSTTAGRVAFSWGASFIMVGLAAGCSLASLVLLGLARAWFPPPDASGASTAPAAASAPVLPMGIGADSGLDFDDDAKA